MSEENRTPPVADWGRPLRKRSRGPVPGPTPSGAPAIGPVDQPVPVGGGETVEGAGAAERSSGSLTPAPAWGAPEDAPPAAEYRAPREPRVAREPDADDLRERDLVAFIA